jgi:hypothetical protein
MHLQKATALRGFVRQSAKFEAEFTCANRTMLAATHSLVRWQAMALCFFLSIKLGIVAFRITKLLSPNNMHGPSTSAPSICKECRYSMANSAAIRAATSSDPHVDVSTVFCLMDIQQTGVTNKKIMPVTDLLVTASCA